MNNNHPTATWIPTVLQPMGAAAAPMAPLDPDRPMTVVMYPTAACAPVPHLPVAWFNA